MGLPRENPDGYEVHGQSTEAVELEHEQMPGMNVSIQSAERGRTRAGVLGAGASKAGQCWVRHAAASRRVRVPKRDDRGAQCSPRADAEERRPTTRKHTRKVSQTLTGYRTKELDPLPIGRRSASLMASPHRAGGLTVVDLVCFKSRLDAKNPNRAQSPALQPSGLVACSGRSTNIPGNHGGARR